MTRDKGGHKETSEEALGSVWEMRCCWDQDGSSLRGEEWSGSGCIVKASQEDLRSCCGQ